MRTQCSRESIIRFIKFFLSLGQTQYRYHQTLTFGTSEENFTDSKVAKKALRKLLDSLGVEMQKEYNMATVYIMGRQQNGNCHFHVLFLFYGPIGLSVEQLRIRLRDAVSSRWEKLSQSKPQGNWLKTRNENNGLWYLMQHFAIAKPDKERGKPLWYGKRNKEVIGANSCVPTPKTVRMEFESNFPRPFKKIYLSVLQYPKERYGWRSLKAERKGVRECCFETWEEFKSQEVEKVSDVLKSIRNECFIKFRKRFGFLK